jgi:hypothetical protein
MCLCANEYNKYINTLIRYTYETHIKNMAAKTRQ